MTRSYVNQCRLGYETKHSIMEKIPIPLFARSNEIVRNAEPGTLIIPKEPLLDPAMDSVNDFLHLEVACPVIDELYDHLYLFAKKSSSHVNPLHAHLRKARSIFITENPGLHLVWYYGMLYVKPIPHCLLNFDFWQRYLQPQISNGEGEIAQMFDHTALSPNCRAAIGFLRTYGYMIRHESDFRIAKASRLLPDDTTYADFQKFIDPFRRIPDAATSPRYHYGQLRLTRLNWAVRIFRFSWYYQTIYIQTGQYLERFAAPLLFLFASLTLIISSMQVGARGSTTRALDGLFPSQLGVLCYCYHLYSTVGSGCLRGCCNPFCLANGLSVFATKSYEILRQSLVLLDNTPIICNFML
jgi:hypothetical protein